MSNPLDETGRAARSTDPCLLVIFGATGDLTSRKLAPALYNLGKEGLLSANFACVGVARRPKKNEDFREEFKKDIDTYSRTKPIDENFWGAFQNQLYYYQTEFDHDEGYQSLGKYLEELDARYKTGGKRIFYLSVQPKFFPLIIKKLAEHGMLKNQERVIIEKPFGHDLKSAMDLQAELTQYLKEEQIYRIDHYLGKETVQNLLVFRFANAIFESVWNYKNIEQVQITVGEDIGIGSRGAFWEETGLLRDIVQNHMMQLLTLVAMEPPASLHANDIQNEKVKVLQSVRPFCPEDLCKNIIRGQYDSGFINGEKVVSYREEKGVQSDSNIETYAAMRLYIDNWRWNGVPFYLRAGKRLPKKGTEIAVIFKDAPGVLFKATDAAHEANVLAIRIQPDEGIAMKINCKVPGPTSPIQPVKMDFRYGSYFGQSPPEAYERLIWDCMNGDRTLFARVDEVEQSWKIFTPVLEYWQSEKGAHFPNYQAGTWGPKEADDLVQWRIL